MKIELTPIGHVEGPYQQKFGIPRQAGLASKAKGVLRLDANRIGQESLREIERFSHLWVLTWFHLAKPVNGPVRPPRLGGNKRVGVFASRSPNHPNPIGLSLVRLLKREGLNLYVSELDLVDQTPILDIKPYIHLWDSKPEASLGWIDLNDKIPQLSVEFSQAAQKELEKLKNYNELREVIIESLSQDPRPAYKTRQEESDTRSYATLISDQNICFKISEGNVLVTKIAPTANSSITESK